MRVVKKLFYELRWFRNTIFLHHKKSVFALKTEDKKCKKVPKLRPFPFSENTDEKQQY